MLIRQPTDQNDKVSFSIVVAIDISEFAIYPSGHVISVHNNNMALDVE